jgi:hypothetical protein
MTMAKYSVSTDFEYPGINGPTDIGKTWIFECEGDKTATDRAYGWLVGVEASYGVIARLDEKGGMIVMQEFRLGQRVN